jgi:aspartyl-tRNA(Asn)/glutamyl-tRNA(Gln) amidotransferase subunit B
MKELGLEQIQDDSHLEEIVKEIIGKFPLQVEQFKSGKEAVIQFLVGQAMATTKGKANPGKLQELFKRLM